MTVKTIRRYQSAGSPNSRRARIFIAQKKIAVTLVPVDLGAPGDVSWALNLE
jgi:glutathione S-transferase